MLSDFMESLLPQSRADEIEKHLESCKACSEVRRDLTATLEVAHALPPRPISHETALKITEACQAGTRKYISASASRRAFLILVPLLVLGSVAAFFPGVFPWMANLRMKNSESDFVRYFPMLEGANEIVEEHGNWLHVKEPAMRSLWEEGGISPDEFEKSFTGKPAVGEDTK